MKTDDSCQPTNSHFDSNSNDRIDIASAYALHAIRIKSEFERQVVIASNAQENRCPILGANP